MTHDPKSLHTLPSEKLQIVCTSDTHGDDPTERIPSGDIFIHAGDLTDPGSMEELQKAYTWISKLPHKIKVVVAGNHDVGLDPSHHAFREKSVRLFTSEEALSHGIHYLDRRKKTVGYYTPTSDGGETTTKQPIVVYGNPLQPDFLNSDYAFTYPPWPSEAATQAWKDAPEQNDGCHIWVTHGPPKDRLDWIDIDGLQGCVAQARAIAASRPLLCVFGHYHVSNGVELVEWCADKDNVAVSKVLTEHTHQREFDFSGEGDQAALRLGIDTVFVNAAWMTGRKREVPDRNDPAVITLRLPTTASNLAMV